MKIFAIILLSASLAIAQASHPNLILTKKDVGAIRKEWKKYPLFKNTFEEAKSKVDKALVLPIDVPVPKDAGGYTHERHKQNYIEMQLAGILYQVTRETKYAAFVKNMLLKYSELYPTLKQHPAAASNSPGRLFWQSLNEYVWVVYTSQAYDCIYDFLSPVERNQIENNVFRKMALFFATERVHELDLIHNHGTWSCAAVGMAGLVLKDKDLIDKALYGSEKNSKGGFIKQLETLFSPDGFYTEGPYYIRYALMPFFIFSEALNNNLPELNIFKFRDSILKKGFYSAMQLTSVKGNFITINDALKEKNNTSPEIVMALDLVMKEYGVDKTLLGIVEKQNSVMLNKAGLITAKEAASVNNAPGFNYKSIEYSDGANGEEGGVGLLRFGTNKDLSTLLMKYTGHGLSHGHYDKLSFLYYDQDLEILQDYGSARFINVEPKYGGRYLPETKSFCFTSVAHNTLVADEKSHFNQKENISEKYHSDKHFFSASDSDFQIMSAKDEHAYDGISMQRTMALINDKRFTRPIVVDVMKAVSETEHQYDLPFYYLGHLIFSNINYTAHDKERKTMGSANGYQHLWNEAEGSGTGVLQVSWLAGERYYTLTSDADESTKVFFTRIGATDPNFNLRNDPGLLIRRNGKSHVFASVIEPHGSFDPIKEFSAGAKGVVNEIKVIDSNEEFTAVHITGKLNLDLILLINNRAASETAKHIFEFNGKIIEWTGNYKLIRNN